MAGGTEARAATLAGLAAIGLWASLAALTVLAGPVPPFQLAAMTFAVGTLVGLAWSLASGASTRSALHAPGSALALGIYGLFAFHACYFLALQNAPAVEASLIVYLWPLLIVLLSAMLPRERGGAPLQPASVGGALLGLAGAVLLLYGQPPASGARTGSAPLGYAMALAAALIWSSYSVASRLFAEVPSASVTASCAATAVLSLLAHLALERTVLPVGAAAWAAVLALGLGPVGLAFYLWDAGMKRGDIRLLGVAAYATPLLSTLVLAAAGLASPSPAVWLAALLIATGAAVAGWGTRSARAKT